MAFDQAKADAVCEQISNGTPMSQACKSQGIGYRTIFRWMEESPPFAAVVAQAREIGSDAIADECMAIADDTLLDGNDIQRNRLRVDTRLKLLRCWNPKRYGDKLQVDQDTRLEIVLTDATSQPAALQQATAAAAIEHSVQQPAAVTARLVRPGGDDA